ncbi:39S ribosomal protein L23, mitochondrial isoform X1 [Oxyura jamaicensis]|uniref:39S ribosomal protein L23, mitochondrial isoform X1 n=1 Tax=Oxyura jamaicensis TaxID=8884 RepID=UPI0015A69B5F|nr:39S ribosomal protein L23, mitochondrial isoform X1 [Oxyura jamaicensis]
MRRGPPPPKIKQNRIKQTASSPLRSSRGREREPLHGSGASGPGRGHGGGRQAGSVPAVPAGRPPAADLPPQLLHAGGAARRAAARGHGAVPRLHGAHIPAAGPKNIRNHVQKLRKDSQHGQSESPPWLSEYSRMTKVDIKNYLEKIYNVPVAAVRTRIQYGANNKKNHKNQRVKKPDYKVAYVQLGKGQTFQFPNLFPEKEQDEEARSFDDFRKKYLEKEQQIHKGDPRRGGVPDWFGL